jgi:threonine/homoserine/homoserine lactone efflux protein
MPTTPAFGLFLAAAVTLALTPGPGIFYVLTRSLKGGRREGVASALGTAVGGMGHVVAAALGVSALLATSAMAFDLVKFAGAAYLVYLGIRTLLSGDGEVIAAIVSPGGTRRAFGQGIVTEVLNPKTALFFLAFIPQFITPERPVIPQFLLLGCISVGLNTGVDFVVAAFAGPLGGWLRRSARLRRGQRYATGCAMIGLGAYVALADSRR